MSNSWLSALPCAAETLAVPGDSVSCLDAFAAGCHSCYAPCAVVTCRTFCMQACLPACAEHSPKLAWQLYSADRHARSVRSALHRCPRRARKSRGWTRCSSNCAPTTILPNGLSVCYASKYDVDFLYREIFQEKVYMRHGIQLAKGSTVIDVGGNIGFFALFAAQHVGTHGRVITAEPIPDLHAKLQYNVDSHSQWCASQGNCTSRQN